MKVDGTKLIQIQRFPVDVTKPDCLSCGACCLFYARFKDGIQADDSFKDMDFVHFNSQDTVFTWPDGDKETVHEEGYFMNSKVLDGYMACVKLGGLPGRSIACSIYPDRPSICRAFPVGGDLCLAIREWAKAEGVLH